MENGLTQGSIKKHYFKYLGSACGGAMISCVYSMVDAAVVGQYEGPLGAAALSIVMPIWTVLYSLGLLVGIGGSVNYSFFKAQGKTEKANAYFTMALLLTSALALACWVGLAVFEEPLLRLFGADDALLALAAEYLKPIRYVVPAYPFTQFLAAFLRNDNAPGRATFAVLLGGAFNVFGDVYFVFGLDMGIFGAGLATALGCAISILVMLSHFLSKKNTLRLNRVYGYIHKAGLLSFSGFSAFVSDIAMGIIAMLFNRRVMQDHGADALAVFGVIVQVSTAVQCSAYGIGQAAQPILSANYAVGSGERVRETARCALWTVAAFSVLWTGLTLAFPNVFVRLFMAPTASVLRLAPGIMRVYGLSYLLLPLNIFAAYYLQALMRPERALVVSLARGVVLCAALIYALPALFGSGTVWWVMPVTELLTAVYAAASMKAAGSVPAPGR